MTITTDVRLYQNYVDGRFTASTEHTDVLNPANQTLVARVPLSTAPEVATAVGAAHRARIDWARRTTSDRAGYLKRLAAAIRAEREHFRDIIIQEQGKTRDLAQVEVDFTADYLDYMAGWALRIEGEVIPSERPNESILLTYRPIGVVAGILPWNFPFFLIARKLAPALLTGNTIVIKPASETPVNAFEFARLADEIGLPPGVFNLVGGDGTSGEALASDPRIGLVTFTGSVPTGRRIMEIASKNLTRVNLELGGKAPAIVLADADLDLAARSIWQSRIINTGQVCNCAEKVLVDRRVHDDLVERLAELFKATRFGDPSIEPELDMGPLINARAVERMSAVVKKAVEEGARVVVGGAVANVDEGHHYLPTLLTNVTRDSSVMREETFGPVLPVLAVDGLDEALEVANDSEYGLTSSIYTRDLSSAMRACRELEYGETYVNRENFEAMQGFHAGRKNSGIGGADGKHGLMEFVETHVAYIDAS